jgi:hypothetical protein
VGLIRYVVSHPLKVSAILVVGIILGLGSYYVYQVASTFGTVATEDFNPAEARQAMESEPAGQSASSSKVTVDASVQTELAGIDEFLARRGAEEASPFDIDVFSDSTPQTSFNPKAYGEPVDDSVFDAYLLVGTDASGHRADTIILALQPTADGEPIMVSLPRF